MDLEQLKKQQCIEYNLQGWGITDTFKVKLKRINLMSLMATGKVPNPLIGTVVSLFKGDKEFKADSNESIKELNQLANFFAEQALAEPTYKDLKENGIELTDTQLMAIYNYALQGPIALIPYLTKLEDIEHSDDGSDVQPDSE